MEIFFQQLINGIVLGSVYAMVAVGYTMVYGILQLINFAHGEVLMIGAMFGLDLCVYPKLAISWIARFTRFINFDELCYFIVPDISSVYRTGRLQAFKEAPRLAPLITAIGISIILQTLAMIIWGASPRVFPDLLSTETIKIGGAILAPKQFLFSL